MTTAAQKAAEVLPPPPNAGPNALAVAQLDGAIRQAREGFGDLTPDSQVAVSRSASVPYLTCPKLLDSITSALAKADVSITSSIELVVGSGFICRTMLSHSGGGWRCSVWPIISPNKDQSVAVSAGWGLRQNLLQLLALSPSDSAGMGDADSPPVQPPAQAGQFNPAPWAPQPLTPSNQQPFTA